MTRIKLCGMRRPEDISAANLLMPEYVGFICCDRFRRYIPPERLKCLRRQLKPGILAVGVFVDQEPAYVAELLNSGSIDLAQLHGSEGERELTLLRRLTDRPIIQAFRITSGADILRAKNSTADYILLDSGAGTGRTFDWSWLQELRRPWFLAGGLNPENAAEAVRRLSPWAVDVSSGIETDGKKDPVKMEEFVRRVRQATAEG